MERSLGGLRDLDPGFSCPPTANLANVGKGSRGRGCKRGGEAESARWRFFFPIVVYTPPLNTEAEYGELEGWKERVRVVHLSGNQQTIKLPVYSVSFLPTSSNTIVGTYSIGTAALEFKHSDTCTRQRLAGNGKRMGSSGRALLSSKTATSTCARVQAFQSHQMVQEKDGLLFRGSGRCRIDDEKRESSWRATGEQRKWLGRENDSVRASASSLDQVLGTMHA